MTKRRKATTAAGVAGILAAACGLAACSGETVNERAAGTAATGPPTQQQVRIPDGPDLVMIPQTEVPMFSCTVLIPAGSALETPATNGAAHYLEHLLFNGTTTRTREEIYSRTDLLGAYNNASTQRERAVFQLLLPSENWKEGLELQSDMLLHSTLPHDMFEKEKGIILEELAKDRTDPEYEADRFTERVLWGDDARALSVLGTEESISGMDPEAVARFYHERYRPAGMTILVMGDFEPDALVAEMTRLYGGGTDGDAPTLPPRPPFPVESAVHYRALDGLGKVRVTVMLPLPGVSAPEYAAADLLATLLADGEHCAVQRAVEAACGPAISCGASLEAGEPWSLLTISAELPEGASGGEAEGTRAPAVGAILRHLGNLLTLQEIAEDLPSARRGKLVEEISLREKMHYYGLMRAALLDSGDPSVAERVLQDTQRLSPADVGEALRSSLRRGLAVATVIGSGAGEGTERLPADLFGAADRPLPELEAGGGAEAIPSPAAVVTAPEARRVVMPDGLTLICQAGPGARTFGAHLLLKDRAVLEERSGVPRGTSDVIHRMMALGTERLDEDALRGELARLGASLKVTDADFIPYDDYYFTPEYSYVRLETIDSFALEALALLGDVVRKPRFTEEALDKAKSAAAARAERDQGSPRDVADNLFLEALGPHHPQAGGVYGPPEEIRALTLEQVKRHHAVMTAPQNLILSVSSNLPFAAIERVVREAFAGPGGPAVELPPWEPAPDTAEPHVVETGREQSWILVGAPLDAEPADEPALRIAVAALSERLAEQLREHEGLAYSIGAGLRLERGPYVRMSAGTRPENLDRMQRGMLEVAAALLTETASAEEIEGARNRGEGRQRMRRLSRTGQAYAMGMAELAGRDPLHLDADAPALRAVTPEDVTRVAARYLAFEHPVVAIAR